MMRVFRFLPTRWWSPSAWKTWKTYVHWRLETYGVFYPAGKINWRALRSLLKQVPSYQRWLGELDEVRKKGC
jgi:hypothetical protein